MISFELIFCFKFLLLNEFMEFLLCTGLSALSFIHKLLITVDSLYFIFLQSASYFLKSENVSLFDLFCGFSLGFQNLFSLSFNFLKSLYILLEGILLHFINFVFLLCFVASVHLISLSEISGQTLFKNLSSILCKLQLRIDMREFFFRLDKYFMLLFLNCAVSQSKDTLRRIEKILTL